MKVSVLVVTYNEEKNLPNCLDSLIGMDDIVVLDSGSEDATCDIARSAGARVLTRSFDNFATQRNYGLDFGSLKHEWVLHLDADEVLTAEFRVALEKLDASTNLDGYRVPSKLLLNGTWLRHAGMYPSYQVRLSHRDRLRFKQVGHGQREDAAPNRIGSFDEPYLHFNFSTGTGNWLIRHVRYAKEEAIQVLADRRESVSITSLWSSERTQRRRAQKALVNRLPSFLRPGLRFLYVFVLRMGFLDGRAGLQYALMLCAYEAMIASFVVESSGDKQK